MATIETWEKVLDPNFINAELLGDVGAEKVVTIKDIEFRECFDNKTQSKVQKQSLIFEECKPMVLNKTNAKTLKKILHSDKPADCIGHKITLYVVKVKVAGKETTGIRIKEFSEVKCEECGKIILPTSTRTVDEIVEIGTRNCGKKLCLACMKKVKEKTDGK